MQLAVRLCGLIYFFTYVFSRLKFAQKSQEGTTSWKIMPLLKLIELKGPTVASQQEGRGFKFILELFSEEFACSPCVSMPSSNSAKTSLLE